MSIYDKISNAQETTWLTDGIAEAEAKSIIELAKISAKIERRRLELNMTQKEFAAYNPIFADRISTTEGRVDLIKDEKIIKSYDEGIFLGVGAGDITYQLRH